MNEVDKHKRNEGFKAKRMQNLGSVFQDKWQPGRFFSSIFFLCQFRKNKLKQNIKYDIKQCKVSVFLGNQKKIPRTKNGIPNHRSA